MTTTDVKKNSHVLWVGSLGFKARVFSRGCRCYLYLLVPKLKENRMKFSYRQIVTHLLTSVL